MKQILIFGDEKSDTAPSIHIGDSESQIKYLTTAEVKAQPNRVLGYQPDLIVNLNKPDQELYMWQLKQSTYHNAQVADLY